MGSVLKVKDSNGNWIDIPSIQGSDYVLTEEDKREIASMVSAVMTIADVPSQVSELGNDAGYITADALADYALKSDIPTVPTNVSAFANDAGYLTQHQSLAGYALKTDIPNVSAYQTEAQVSALIQAEIAGVVSGLPTTETWTFTLEDGSTVTKAVCVK